jgi:RNA polymerase sigma factor (sigma-70 family)
VFNRRRPLVTADGRRAETDRVDFGDWVRPHMTAMARLAGRLAPSADRDDIVQEALTRACQKRSLFDPERGSARAWLLALTADRARKATRRRVGPILLDRTVRPSMLDDRLDIEAAVSRLAPRQRLAVDCFYFVGLTVTETAAVMKCAEGTVKSCLSDARAQLRVLLVDRA